MEKQIIKDIPDFEKRPMTEDEVFSLYRMMVKQNHKALNLIFNNNNIDIPLSIKTKIIEFENERKENT